MGRRCSHFERALAEEGTGRGSRILGEEFESIPHARASTSAALARAGLSNLDRNRLAQFLGLRNELLELDCRWSELGRNSVFALLDGAGVLDHRIPGVDEASILRAKTEPPATGRANVRGAFVSRAQSDRRRYQAGWMEARDLRANRSLDLCDPFCAEEKWVDLPQADESPQTLRENARSFWHSLIPGRRG